MLWVAKRQRKQRNQWSKAILSFFTFFLHSSSLTGKSQDCPCYYLVSADTITFQLVEKGDTRC